METSHLRPGTGLPLEGYRVLDLCEGPRSYCGRLLCDLGAQVLKVEPAQGEPGRHAPPVVDAGAGSISLAFQFFNAGKRSAVVDMAHADPWAPIGGFVSVCDVVLEDIEPGSDRTRLRETLRQRLEGRSVVWTSLTGYGTRGPMKGAPASDLTLLAHSGLLSLAGEPSREPLGAFGGIAWLGVATFAAMGALGALYRRSISGKGAEIDASAVEAMAHSLETAPQFLDLEGVVRKRTGNRVEAATGVFACNDGFVYLFTFMGGSLFNWNKLVDWLEEAGVPGAASLREPRWTDSVWRKTQEAANTFDQIFSGFARTRSRQHLFEEGQRRGVIIGAVHQPSSLVDDPALRQRGFFRPLLLEGLGEIAFPGAPYRFRAADIGPRGSAPSLGEFSITAGG